MSVGVRTGVTYWLGTRLYVNVTSRLNARPFMELRGKGFQMPKESGFRIIEEEPTAEEIFSAVDDAYAKDDRKKIGGMGEDDTGVTYAGYGEPLLCLDTITESATMILESRHGIPLRIKTNGLVPGGDNEIAVQRLVDAGISQASVYLPGSDPKSFERILTPEPGYSFGQVCDFITQLSSAGVLVECTTIASHGIDVPSVRQLAQALGAVETRVL